MSNMHTNQQAVFDCGILFCLTNFIVCFFLAGAIGQGRAVVVHLNIFFILPAGGKNRDGRVMRNKLNKTDTPYFVNILERPLIIGHGSRVKPGSPSFDEHLMSSFCNLLERFWQLDQARLLRIA
jgi:hypothetical protein